MAWGRFEVCLLALEPMLFPIPQCCQSIPKDFIFTNNFFPYCKSTTYMCNRQHALMQAKKLILPTWTKGNLSEGDEVAQRTQGNTEDSGSHFTEASVAWSSWYQTATEGGRSPKPLCSCKSQGDSPAGLAWFPYLFFDFGKQGAQWMVPSRPYTFGEQNFSRRKLGRVSVEGERCWVCKTKPCSLRIHCSEEP